MTLEEIKNALKELKLLPNDVFSNEELAADPVIVAHVKTEKSNEYFARQRNLDTYIEKEKTWNTEKEDMQKKLDTSDGKNRQMEATMKFDEFTTERKLDERQITFVKSKMKEFVPENGDLKASVNKFLDTTLTEYDAQAKLFGVEKKKADDKTEDNATGGDDDSQEDVSKYLDPEKNPFIPKI